MWQRQRGLPFRTICGQPFLMYARKLSPNHSSMLQDVESSRPTEIDYMNGSLVQMARE